MKMEVSDDSSEEHPHANGGKCDTTIIQSSDDASHNNHSTAHYMQSSSSNPIVIKTDMLLPIKSNTTMTTSLHQSIPSIHASSSNDHESYGTLDYVDSPIVSIQDDPQAKFSGGLLSDTSVNFVEIDEQNLKSCGDSLDVYFDMIPGNISNASSLPVSSGFITRPEHQTPKASLLLRAYSDIRNSQAQENQVSPQVTVDSGVELTINDHTEYLIPEILNGNLGSIGDVILPHSFVKSGKMDTPKKGIQIHVQQPMKIEQSLSTDQHYDGKDLMTVSTSNLPQYMMNNSNHGDFRNHQVFTGQPQQMPHYQIVQKISQGNSKSENIEYILQKVDGNHQDTGGPYEDESSKVQQDFTIIAEPNSIPSHSKENDTYMLNNVPLVSRSGRLIRRKPEYIDYVNSANMTDMVVKDDRMISVNMNQRDLKSSEVHTEECNRESSLDEDSAGPCEGKKSLPHKKRIPKNLKRTKKLSKGLSSKDQSSFVESIENIPDPLEIDGNKCDTKSKNFVCELCKKDFDSQFSFFSHLKTHYEPSLKYECDFCRALFDTEALLTEHIGTHSREHFKCSICYKTFRKQSALDDHVTKNHTDSPEESIYTCSMCPQNFVSQFTLDAHYQANHAQNGIEFICENCYLVFDSKEKLQTHVKSEHKEEPKPRGAPKKRKKAEKIILECPQCPRTFTRKNSLEYHLRGHTGERPYQCDTCNKAFFAASALKVHLRMHTGEKPHKCDKCDKYFRQWGDLHYHTSTAHSDARLFQCEFCGKDFKRKYCLVVHRRIHTGDRKYKCEVCSKGFRAASYLQNHARIHTGEKPYPCPECGKTFRVRSDMKRHTLTHRRDTNNARSNYSSKTNATIEHQTTEPLRSINNQILQGALSQGQLIITDNLESIIDPDSLRIVVSGMSSSSVVQPSSSHKFTQSNSVVLNRVAMTTMSPSSCDNSNPGVLLMENPTQQPVNLNVIPRIVTDAQTGNELIDGSRNSLRNDTTNICVWPGIFSDQPQQ